MVKIPDYIQENGQKWLKKLFLEYSFDKSEIETCFQAAGCLDRIAQAQQAIMEHGLLQEDRHGMLKVNPGVLVERDNKILFARLCRELGVTGPDDSRLPRKGGQK